MECDPKKREEAVKMLNAIKSRYGSVPLVTEVLSERPDKFIPVVHAATQIMEKDSSFDSRTRYLLALSAAAALGGEHCIRLQMNNALKAGASRDEVLETLLISSYMSMTRSQSYSFRIFREVYGSEGNTE
ncbi:MAG: carboxymuconolactone decarboxylase family protein [Candidatus Methanomethylophilus sp.]|nr:carboxymuconolactone decarboxylase family protein [Methanomethylophilus sp.]MDD4221847.1 carboxymuconolactone decarboxylase family protein [Methanomethylophilus sp.]MDD4669077.1 carboxymuconolactone decarboxylase family protein [Methanomethylophilus sp.]